MIVKTTIALFFATLILSGCENKSPSKQLVVWKLIDTTEISGKEKAQKDSLMILLPKLSAKSLDCTADVYWKIVKRGKASISLLIESLADTTLTNIYDNCKHGKLNVGDVSYFALEEIAEFPAMIVTHIQFDLVENGCWNFYDYLFDNRNKKTYQKMARNFFYSNKFVYVEYNEKELNTCRKKYDIGGKYKWQQ